MPQRPLTRLAAALALCGALACQAQNIAFVDAHVHLNDPQMQIELMERFGATQAVVFWGGLSSNASVREASRMHPGRFIPFASVSPERADYRRAWDGDASALLAELEAMLASGVFKGIGEINAVHFASARFAQTRYSPSGPVVSALLALARKHRVPVLLHVELTHMAELSSLLERYPDVPVIWAHGGYTPLVLARGLLRQHPNLFYELSARTWAEHPRSPEFTILRNGSDVWPAWLALIEEMPERFLVGTDASHRSRQRDTAKFASVQNFLHQLSPTAQRLVGQENILRLVRATPPPGAVRAPS